MTRMEDILGTAVPQVRTATRVMDPRVAYIITSPFYERRYSAAPGAEQKCWSETDIGGKTGTTNGPRDAWFSGFNGDLVTTTWLGFDDYSPLGRREFGGTAALPIWIDFMREALPAPQPDAPMPPGIVPDSASIGIPGCACKVAPSNSVMEYFLKESLPDWGDNSSEPIDTETLEGIF